MKKYISIIIIAAIVVFVAYRLKSNHDKINTQSSVQVNISVVTVNTSPVLKLTNDREFELTGTLATDQVVTIAAETQGKIVSLNCQAGQVKTKGAVIAVIDDKLKRLAVQTAKVNLDKLKKDCERKENLYKGNAATEQQLDEIRTAYENAIIQLDEAEKQLAYTQITAPISGMITSKSVEEGSFVNTGSTIASIVNVSKLKAKVNASESIVYSLTPGTSATITTDAYPGVEFAGKITFVSPKGDDSHNYPVEAEIANSGAHQLKAGTFVNVKIKLKNAGEGLYIPRAALQGSVREASVYVAENGVARIRKIVIGNESADNLQVLSGLKEGEQVVTNGQVNLTDNKQIKIVTNK